MKGGFFYIITKRISAACPPFWLLLACMVCSFTSLYAQDTRSDSLKQNPGLQVPPDSVQADSLGADSTLSDNLAQKDSARKHKPPKGAIKTTVNYHAKDSIRMDMTQRKAYLYGEAHADYDDIKLDARRINIDYKEELITAKGVPNDSTGKLEGTPVFVQKNDEYEADEIKYNFKSRKAMVVNVKTEQGEGILRSDTVIKVDDNTVLAQGNFYSPCLLPEPNYYIRAKKIKLIKGDKIVAGPWNVYLGDVPTPIGFLFGMFPQPKENASGVIVPTYGESRDRGFFLRNGGYYFTIKDYVGIKVLGEIYSKGSYGFNILSNYKKRYYYDGNIQIRYNRRITGDLGVDREIGEDYWLTWSHQPVQRGATRFSANVNLGSSNYNRRNSFQQENYLSTQFRSSIKYSGSIPNTPFNFALNMDQSQNTNTGIWNMSLPSANLGMRRLFPFKPKSGASKTWYHKLGFNYNMNFNHQVSNGAVPRLNVPGIGNKLIQRRSPRMDSILPVRGPNFEDILQRGQMGVQHNVNISTSARILKHINFSPSFAYSESWYRRKLSYDYIEEKDSIQADTVSGFARSYNFNTGANMVTRIYGFYNINGKKLKKIRHTLNPTVGFNYTPDFSNPIWGQYETVQSNSFGGTQRVSPYQLGIGRGPGNRESGSVNFGLTNTVEAKVAKKTTGQEEKKEGEKKKNTEKVTLLDNLSINGSYDMIRPEFKLSNFNLSARTKLFRLFNINTRATIDPYYYDPETNERINRYAWHRGQGIGSISNANVAVTTSLNPNSLSGKKSDAEARSEEEDLSIAEEQELAWILANPDLYVDWSVPWNLSVSYNLQYTKQGFAEANTTQTLRFNGDVNLTEKWKVGFTSSYDFELREMGFTSLNIYRDMHCWEMRVNWIPFGPRQSYSLEINAKASMLKDLKISRRRSWYDR